jgi:hypothetical protein
MPGISANDLMPDDFVGDEEKEALKFDDLT